MCCAMPALLIENPTLSLGGQGVSINGRFLAERFGMSQSGVVYAVNSGEKIAREGNFTLLK